MSVTQPTHDWDFRQTVSSGGTINDTISGTTATYNNASSDATNGLDLTTSGNKFVNLNPFNTGTEFSMEFYFQKTAYTTDTYSFLADFTSNTSSFGADVNNFVCFFWDKNNEPHDLGARVNGHVGTLDTLLIDDANVYAHFVFTFNATTNEAKYYLNGSLVITDTVPNTTYTDTTYTHNYIGSTPFSTSSQFHSYFYYFRYWKNGVLSSSEISTLYANRSVINSFSTSYESGLVPSFDYDFRTGNKDLINGTAEAKYYQYSSGTSTEITKENTINGVSIVGDTPTAAVSGSSSGRDNAGGQYIDLTGDLDTSYDQITIEVYVNIDSTTEKQVDNAGIFHFGWGDREEMFKLYTNYGTKDYINMVAQYNDTTTSSITTFTESSLFQNLCDGNTYMHLVYTCNGPTVTVYLNGASFLTNTNSSFSFASTTRSLCELGRSSMYSTIGGFLFATYKYCRIYNTALSSTQAATLYNNRDSLNHFSFASLRSFFGDVYLTQTLNKTISDYKAENISLHDISFGAFPSANKYKQSYIQGPVDISGDLIVRSDNNVFYDISASNIGFTQRTVTTVTDASYGVFASTTSSYTSTNVPDPLNVGNYSSHRYGRSVDMTRDGNYIAAGVLAEGRAYVWKVDDMTVTELGDRLVPNTGTGRFGTIKITGDGSKAVVCNHNTTGNPNQFTYIWSNPGSTTGSWSEVTTARITNSSYTEGRRTSMSQDGNVFIKGGDTSVDRDISTWIWSTDQWVSPGNITPRASGSNLSDNALNVDGTICVVGGRAYDSNKGYIAAYKYSKATTETDGSWNSLGDYIDINETDGTTLQYWGTDVCINDAGDIVAAAALGDGTNVTYDLIKAYKYNTPGVLGGTWTQLGDDMKPTAGLATEGTSVQNMDMNGDGSIIAYGMDAAGTNGGAVIVYQYSLDPQIAGGTWSQIAFIERPTTSSNLTNWNFGTSVRLNSFGNKLHVGITPGGTAGVGYTYLINIDHTVDYRTTTTTSTPKVITNDLSLNNRFFVGGDASFNGNVTIQGDLSLGSTISLHSTIANSAVNIGSTGANTFTHDVSLNANLAIHGKTTVKNDLYLNAYTDVSANPVLSDGTYLKNMKMDKLNHRYIMDISRSAPFSTLTSNTLPSEIWDNSSNSGICVSADGKYIRTVNSGDLSSNALSYFSEDYGSSFHEDEELSQKLSICDISINTSTDYNYYHAIVTQPATIITDAPTFNNFLTSGATYTQTFTVDGITYTCSLSQSTLGSGFDMWRAFKSSTGVSSDTCCTSRTNNYYQDSSYGNYTNNTISYTDFNGNSATQNAQWMIVDINDGNSGYYQVTRVQVNSVYVNNYITEWMIFGRNESGNTVQLSDAVTGGWGALKTITITDETLVNQIYIAGTKGRTHNSFVSFHNIEFDLAIPETRTPITSFKYGSDKSFMSYNGQHQLVPKGVSNKLTYDDYLYVSNNFGKNWNLRKSSTLRTFNYTVTANGSSNYILNGETYTDEAQPTVNIGPNESVVFTIDTTTNGSHPFKIGTSSDGGEITDSRITSVTSGSNQVITFTPTSSGTFYYYCSAHTGMGNSITVANYNMGPFSPSTWFWNTGAVSADGKHMYVSGSSGFWKSSDYGRVWNQTSADSSFNYMSISADGKLVYGVNERKVYGSTDYGNTFSTLYTDAYTSDSSYCGISTSGNGKYITIADKIGSNIYLSSDYGNTFDLKSIPSGDYTNLGIPTPAYDWDFRQVATTGVNSNGKTLTYLGGLTSDATNGASFTAAAGEYMIVDNVPIPAAFSIEMYYYLDTIVASSTIFSIYAPSSGTFIDHMSSGHSYWYENDQWNSVWRETAKINGTSSTTVNGWRSVSGIAGNTWYHRVIVFNGSTWQEYQNGVVGQYQNHTHIAQDYSIGIMGTSFGSNVGSDFKWKCFRVYNSALTADDVTTLYNQREVSNVGLSTPLSNTSINCGMSHSGKIILNSNYISYNYGNNFSFVPNLINNQLTNNDTFYSKANLEYILDPSNNALLQIPYKSAIFQDIYSVGSIKAGSTTYSSDYRLKENVQPLTENETVNELHPVKYYNTNLKKNDYGLLAHELQEKYPFLVSGEKDGAENQSINYNGLISLLVHEVKNLKKEYQELVEMKNNA